MEDSCECIE